MINDKVRDMFRPIRPYYCFVHLLCIFSFVGEQSYSGPVLLCNLHSLSLKGKDFFVVLVHFFICRLKVAKKECMSTCLLLCLQSLVMPKMQCFSLPCALLQFTNVQLYTKEKWFTSPLDVFNSFLQF